jgi:hypothetical protein
MRMSGSTAALVALEDASPEELFACLRGTTIPLWPLLRWPLAAALAHTEYDTDLAPRLEGVVSKARRLVRMAQPSPRSARTLRGPVPVLFSGTGSRNIPSPSGEVNPLLGPFAEVLGDDAAMVQYEPIATDRRSAFTPTVTLADAIAAAELRARLVPTSAATLRESREVAEAILGRVDHQLEPARRDRALRMFEARVRRAATLAGSYARLLDNVRPRVLVLQQAAYGDRSTFVAAAHERGILVAEPQHGWIGASHGAYNFGAAASDPRLRVALPDVLLTFGDFWSESINVPFATTVVGKAAVDDARRDVVPLGERPREVLYVSTVVDPEEVARFVLTLRDAVPTGWTIVFRPHPKERGVVSQRYPSLVDAPGIRLDDERDPFRSFARSRVVVGATSTALYEVLALGTPTVLRVSAMTPFYMDPHIFTNLIEPGEDPKAALTRAIETPELDLTPALVERVWAGGSRDRFREWADHALDSAAERTAP